MRSALPIFRRRNREDVFLFATMGWLGAYAGVFRSTKAAVAVCSLLALSAEGLQMFFPERSPYLRDAAINLVAAWAALGWHYRVARPPRPL